MAAALVVPLIDSLAKLGTSSIEFSKLILTRTLPSKVQELEKLNLDRISVLTKIKEQRRLKPSERVETILESLIENLQIIDSKIEVINESAKIQLQNMFANNNQSTDTVKS